MNSVMRTIERSSRRPTMRSSLMMRPRMSWTTFRPMMSSMRTNLKILMSSSAP